MKHMKYLWRATVLALACQRIMSGVTAVRFVCDLFYIGIPNLLIYLGAC